jgi:hypothetical protein
VVVAEKVARIRKVRQVVFKFIDNFSRLGDREQICAWYLVAHFGVVRFRVRIETMAMILSIVPWRELSRMKVACIKEGLIGLCAG